MVLLRSKHICGFNTFFGQSALERGVGPPLFDALARSLIMIIIIIKTTTISVDPHYNLKQSGIKV